MKLEDAVLKIERASEYGDRAYQDLKYWETRSSFMNDFNKAPKERIRRNLHSALCEHNNVYDSLDLLDEWAKANFPDAKSYGKDAEKWLQTQKEGFYGFSIGSAGYVIGLLGLAAGFPLSVAISSLIAGSLGTVLSKRCQIIEGRLNRDNRERDISIYKQEISRYYGLDKKFNGLNFKTFRESLDNYAALLNNLTNELESNFHEGEVSGLIDNQLEVDNLGKNISEIVQTVRKSKKYPVPSWCGEIGLLTLYGEGDITSGHFKDRINDLKSSLPQLVSK